MLSSEERTKNKCNLEIFSTNFRHSLIPIFFFCSIFSGISQCCLPFYETTEQGELLLLSTDSIPQNVEKYFNTVSIIAENKICYAKFDKFRIYTESECCTSTDPRYLVGTIKVKKKNCTGTIISGKVDQAKILNYNLLKSKINPTDWVSKEFQNPKSQTDHGDNYKYRWIEEEINGKKDITLQRYYMDEYREPLKVLLKDCIHIQTDSIDFFYCPTDTTNLPPYNNTKWCLLYINKKLIYVTQDVTGTGRDGYGPFFYQEQKLSSIYKAKGTTYYYFSAGYVIYFQNNEWKQAYKEPLRYYGECDCGE